MKSKVSSENAICPFKLDRASRDSLTDQLTNGLRDAIHSRFYKADDILPSMPELARHLGISEIIVRAAYRRLAEEGLVLSRPRIGTTVLPSKSPIWRGHVLCVMCDHDFNCQLAVGVEKTRELLTKNGYLFSQVAVLESPDGTMDCSGLDVALSRPVDFVVLFYDRPRVLARLVASGIPFVVVGGIGDIVPGCVGRIVVSFKKALGDFVRHCRRAKVTNVEIVSCSRFDTLELEAAKVFKRIGIMVKRTVIEFDDIANRCENAMHAGFDFIANMRKRRRFRFPNLYFVTDDWVASGMLNAFLSHGVDIPGAVRFVCYSNGGFGPIFPKSLACLMRDPFENGDEIAKRLYDHLVSHKPFPDSYIECKYIHGDTFPG